MLLLSEFDMGANHDSLAGMFYSMLRIACLEWTIVPSSL